MISSFELKKELDDLATNRRQSIISVANRTEGAHIVYQDKAFIDFTIQDTFGYSKHPQVLKVASQVLNNYGIGSYSSRVLSGTTEQHRLCEARICELTGYKSALLFSTRNQAIWTLISCLLDERDAIILADGSLSPFADAAHLVNAECLAFHSNSTTSFKQALERATGKRRKLVVIQAVDSYTGKIININDFWPIITNFGASLIVDESSSFAVLGARGAGIFDHLNLLERPLGGVFDFSCHLGTAAAALCGSPELISLIINRSRTISGELPLAPHFCAGLTKQFDLLELAITERKKLSDLANYFVGELRQQGWGNVDEPDVPVVTLSFSDYSKARLIKSALFDRGVLCCLASSAATLKETAFIRFNLSLSHSIEIVNKVLTELFIIKTKG